MKVFPQPNKSEEECSRFYAQFDNISSVNTIWQHVNRLRGKEDHHVMIYVPSSHQDQYSYLNNLGYHYRKPPTGQEKCSIRVRYGAQNLYLQYKPLNSKYWSTVQSPDLPAAKFRDNTDTSSSFSPPVGRQRLCSKRGRSNSSSPQHRSRKVSKTDENIAKDSPKNTKLGTDIDEVFDKESSNDLDTQQPHLNSKFTT